MLDAADESLTLRAYLERGEYSREFIEHYLVPMGAAIWSAKPSVMFDFPAAYFVRFFHNHGMLSVDDRPTWRVVQGGSRTYVERLLEEFPGVVRTGAPVESIRRHPTHVDVTVRGEGTTRYDAVVVATHSDTALKMLADPTSQEREILGAIPYQKNEAVLHTDESLMPRRKLAWAAWNYHIPHDASRHVAVTYNRNILQSLASQKEYLVTLNSDRTINPDKIIQRVQYEHPIYSREAVAAQRRQAEINCDRTFFCGAYWRNGFHEDGVVSALDAVAHFEERLADGQLHLRRAS